MRRKFECLNFDYKQKLISYMFDSHHKAKTTSFSTMKQLPLNGLYHMRNYSSDGNWLGYQVTLN